MHTGESHIDKFCCIAVVVAAIVLIVMGFSEMSNNHRIQSSNACGRTSNIAEAPGSSAKNSNVMINETAPHAHLDVDHVMSGDTWLNTAANSENAYMGQPVDENAAFDDVFHVDESTNGTDVWKDFKAPSTESVLASSNQRPFSMMTEMEDSRQSANLGLNASVRDAVNPLPKPKLSCDSTICFHSSESHATAVLRQRAAQECI